VTDFSSKTAGSGDSERPQGPPRRILHVDCDAFFVQVARLEDPEEAGRAELLLVGGSPERRGVVTSASYEARAYGVHSAMPMARALRLCPEATVVPVPRRACSGKSREIRGVLETAAPRVEAASIDEFYLDLTGTDRLFAGETLKETADEIRRRVGKETRISVSVGGATGKLVAKLATARAKPDGVQVVPPGEEGTFLRSFALEEIPGVGPALLERLHEKGLTTVEEVVRVEEEWLREWVGDARGRWLWERVRGIDPTPVRPSSRRKSISSERTFARDVADGDAVEEALLGLVVSATGDLREEGLRARTVTVKLRSADFTTRQSSRTLPEPVESEAGVFTAARPLLRRLFEDAARGVRLVGVTLSGLEPRGGPVQLTLFGGEGAVESARDRSIARAVDDLRQRYGDDAVLPARIVDRDG